LISGGNAPKSKTISSDPFLARSNWVWVSAG
jgi:hypothetical protein